MKLRHDEYFHSENTPIKTQPEFVNGNTSTTGHQLNISDLRKKLSPSFDKQISDVKKQKNDGMQCQQCTKWFARAEDLKSHLLLSCPNMIQSKKPTSVEKPFELTQSKRFGATNLKCDFCDNEYKFERTKQKHMQRYHADKLIAPKVNSVSKIFNCEQCHRMYSDENSLKRHIEAIHPSEPEMPTESQRQSLSDSQPVNKKRREPPDDKKSKQLDSQLNVTQKSTISSSTKTLSLENENSEDANDNISIYCDEDNMQCLICLLKHPNLELLRNHIRTEHAAVSSVESEKAIENSNEATEEIEGVIGIQFPSFDWTGDFEVDNEPANEHQVNSQVCFECRICGKTFNNKLEFDCHVALPHKIAIRTAVD